MIDGSRLRLPVVLLAPMRAELAPLRRALGGRRVRLGGVALHVGTIGSASAAATQIGVGTPAAARATERLLDVVDADHVVVVGIAGGVHAETAIGTLVMPDRVVDGASGTEYLPHRFGDVPPQGTLWTTDTLLRDPEVLRRLAARGVLALDMETAAVAAVCERRGCRWSVVRAISDRSTDAALDDSVLALARPDGGPDLPAVASYLLAKPTRIRHLARLGRDMRRAADVAAAHAIRSCR